ncbi:YdcF family protein [Deinococcus sp. SDU3-2]|uniref:YdcF family protein n=1 Tax=Deinococcus terrestris TaxID=2651870 RepID=A0A7X1TRC1_9DEIO|nr:YdcF family protein [Deinococcus terrestris]
MEGAAIGAALAVLATYLGEIRGTAPLLLALVVGGGLAGAFTPARRGLRVGSGGLAAVLALCLLTPVLRAPLAGLVLSQSPVRADAIVVLGAGVQCGTGTLDPHSLARLVRGLELWRAGYAPRLTVSEPSGLLGPANCPPLSDLQRAHIRALYPSGGPEVLTLRRVTTTRDEAARVRALAHERGWRRVLVVTSPSHSRRATRLVASGGVEAVSVPAGETRFDMTLPLPFDRLAALRVVLYEGLSRVKAGVGGTPER